MPQPHSLRQSSLRSLPTGQLAPEAGVAVMLNANARRVTPKVVRSLSHVVPEEDLFVSRSELDLRRITDTILDRRYHTVFCGGGDGTFVGLASEVFKQLEHRPAFRHLRAPRFGILKLGTGNGIASLLQASSLKGDRILDDVLRARAGEVPGYRRLDLLEIDGRRAHFAGVGVDGKVINDYLAVKQRFADTSLKRLLTGPGGYLTAIALKTVPYCLTQPTWVDCEVTNGNGVAQKLSPQGGPVGEPFGPGEVIFRGKVMIACAATIPYYGYGFKMFPFAGQKRGHMHLRLAAIPTLSVLANLPKLWKARYHHPGIHDFHAQEVKVRFSRPMPLQIGGDAEGYRSEFTLGMAREQVEMVDFTGAVN